MGAEAAFVLLAAVDFSSSLLCRESGVVTQPLFRVCVLEFSFRSDLIRDVHSVLFEAGVRSDSGSRSLSCVKGEILVGLEQREASS